MNPSIISLENRLNKLKGGYASDPQYVACLTEKLGNMPMSDYLYGFSEEFDQVCQKLDLFHEEAAELTYQEFCSQIHKKLYQEKDKKLVREMVYLLIIPVLVSYEETV